MNTTTEPKAGLRLFYLDGSGVLFSQATQELHLLNPMAAVIWSLLEEGNDEAALAAALQETCGLDNERSRQFVSGALADWRDKGFLGDSARVDVRVPDQNFAAKPLKGPPWPGPAEHEVREYRILNSNFIVRFSSEAQAHAVRPVLEHLEAMGDAVASSQTLVDVIEASQLRIFRDQEFFAECVGVNALAPVVKSLIWTTVVRDHRYFLNIHAGVVSDGSRCILLPASPGSGKSTLTAALIHAGFKYFSDEVALLEDRTLNVFPVPLAICVKESGIEVLADRFPQLRRLAIHDRGDGKRVAYMVPPVHCRPSNEESRPVAALVFPRFTPGASTSLLYLPRSEALQRLMDECLAVSEPLDTNRVEALVQWIAKIPCYSLRYQSTDDAVSAVSSVLSATAAEGDPP